MPPTRMHPVSDVLRETKAVRECPDLLPAEAEINADEPYPQGYIQPYHQVYCGLGNPRSNPDNNLRNKVDIANPRFCFAIRVRPAALEAVLDTPSRPLIPPSLQLRKGSAPEMGKNIQYRSRGEPKF